MGAAAFDAMMDAMSQNAKHPQVLLHADAHPFNVLVEKQGGDKVVICDWEMAHMGPSGRDVGCLQAFPILCALWHALLGNAQEAYRVVDCVEEFWSEYAKVLHDKGKDEDYLRTTFRNCLGYMSGYFFPMFYSFGTFEDQLPSKEGIPDEHRQSAKAAVGAMGLRFRRLAFGNYQMDLTLDELRSLFKASLTNDIEMLLDLAHVKG